MYGNSPHPWADMIWSISKRVGWLCGGTKCDKNTYIGARKAGKNSQLCYPPPRCGVCTIMANIFQGF